MREPSRFRRILPGDDVFFWISGTGFSSWVRATSSLYILGSTAPQAHWTDLAGGGYTHRFEFEVVSDDLTKYVTWGELQLAAGRNYAPPAPANPVIEPAAETFLRSLFGRQADIAFHAVSVDYEPGDDMRKRASQQIAIRQGQGQFRNQLIAAYEGTCAVTGSTVTSVLEAAHIDRYFGVHTNHVTNGILLRSDIHTLFDQSAVTIAGDFTFIAAPWLHGSEYGVFHQNPIRLPASASNRPDGQALSRHRASCGWL